MACAESYNHNFYLTGQSDNHSDEETSHNNIKI